VNAAAVSPLARHSATSCRHSSRVRRARLARIIRLLLQGRWTGRRGRGEQRTARLDGYRLAKDKNREGRGYSFEVMRARMLYITKHKKKAPTAKVSPFYKKTIGYGLPDFAEELNYGVDLSTI